MSQEVAGLRERCHEATLELSTPSTRSYGAPTLSDWFTTLRSDIPQ